MKAFSFRMFIVCALLALASDVSAARPRSRQVQGVIESVKMENRELVVVHSQSDSPKDLVWTKQTRFIQNEQFASPGALKKGELAQVNYRSPFFGKKFVTKVKWNTESIDRR